MRGLWPGSPGPAGDHDQLGCSRAYGEAVGCCWTSLAHESTLPSLWVCSVVASPRAKWDLLSWAGSLSLGTLCAPVSRDGLLPGGGGR